jgi:hypothetical protein
MRELNRRNRSLRFDKPGDAGQRFGMLIGPQTEVVWGNAAHRGDGRRFDHHQPHTAHGTTAEMYEMPIVRKAVDGAVLAHRRHGDPVAKRDAPNRQRGEHVDLGHFAVVRRLRKAAVRRRCRLLMPAMACLQCFTSAVSHFGSSCAV